MYAGPDLAQSILSGRCQLKENNGKYHRATQIACNAVDITDMWAVVHHVQLCDSRDGEDRVGGGRIYMGVHQVENLVLPIDVVSEIIPLIPWSSSAAWAQPAELILEVLTYIGNVHA